MFCGFYVIEEVAPRDLGDFFFAKFYPEARSGSFSSLMEPKNSSSFHPGFRNCLCMKGDTGAIVPGETSLNSR